MTTNMTRMLFDKGPRRRSKPLKRMHVLDAGPGEDGWHMVRMACSRCDLETCWFQVSTITEAKRGIPCPKCNNLPFKTDEYGEYEPVG